MSVAGQAVVPCWNCDQVVQATATTCLWCGVAVRPTVTPIVMAPSGAAPAPVGAPAPQPQPDFAPTAAPGAYTVPQRAPKSQAAPLSAAFSGTSTSVGAQVAAFTIDVSAVAAVALVVQLTVGSALITVLAAIEALIFLWVLEARTGLTVGHLLLRIRSSQAASPYSPGAGRAFLRQTLLNAGLLVGIVGAWVVAGSGAWDSTGRRRSLAARASGTLAVTPPRAAHTAPAAGLPPSPLAPGTRSAALPAAGLATPRVVTTATLGSRPAEDSQSASATGTAGSPGIPGSPRLVTSLNPVTEPQQPVPAPHGGAGAASIAPVPGTPAPQAPAPATQAPLEPASPLVPGTPAQVSALPPEPSSAPVAPVETAPTAPAPAHGGALLLVFDTGQRVTLALGIAINLGRKPAALDPTDQLVSVEDPEGSVSKLHARLEHSRGQTWVTDQGSTNGTDLLGDDGVIRLQSGVRTLVEDGMRTRLGNRSFTVSVLLDPTPSPEIPT